MGKLDETSDLIELYIHHTGRSEVPKMYHFWCAIFLIAASVGNRVFYRKFAESQLMANMYMILIGPSGSGKGAAIDTAMKFLSDPGMERCNYFRGKATHVSVIDMLHEQTQTSLKGLPRGTIGQSALTLVMPELSHSIGKGPMADDFVKTMTELYSSGGAVVHERTRTSGVRRIDRPCINWLAGSTVDWMMDTINKDHVLSGFFGRTCAIQSEGRVTRILDPTYPPDYPEVRDHIAVRLLALSRTTGVFSRTADAKEVEHTWYMNRPEANDRTLEPFEGREHDLMLKLAMIFSLSEGHDELVLHEHHMAKAQDIVSRLRSALPGLIAYAHMSSDSEPRAIVADIIRNSGSLPRSHLTRKACNKGLNARRMDEAIATLMAEDAIKVHKNERNVKWYTWKTRRRGLKAVDVDTVH